MIRIDQREHYVRVNVDGLLPPHEIRALITRLEHAATTAERHVFWQGVKK